MSIKPPTITNQLMPGHAGRGRDGFSPKIIVIHTQWGKDNPRYYFLGLGTSGQNAADCTIWNDVNGNLYRYLYDSDTAWTNGSWTEPINHANPVLDDLWRRGIYSGDVALTVENEGYQTLTDAQLESLAQLCAWWCSTYGIPADRNHIVGHYEIGPHKQCPGFKLEPLVARTQEILKGATPNVTPAPQSQPQNNANQHFFDETGLWVINDGQARFLDEFNSVPFKCIGFPKTGMYYDQGRKKLVQWFERARLEYNQDKNIIEWGLVGDEARTAGA